MLVDKDHVPVRIHEPEAPWPGRGFIGLIDKDHPLALHLTLDVPDIRIRLQALCPGIPAWIEREGVFSTFRA